MFQGVGSEPMKILLAAGGTGGHKNAALNLFKALNQNGDRDSIEFIVTADPAFETKLKENKINYTAFVLRMPERRSFLLLLKRTDIFPSSSLHSRK